MKLIPPLVILLLLSWAGCGYRFGAGGRVFPVNVRTISVDAGENSSREVGLGKELALAIEREFRRRGPLRVANDPRVGDVLIECSVHSLDERPISFNRNDEAVEYRATVIVDVSLLLRETGKTLWEARGLSLSSDYSSVASSVVTTSAEFRSLALGAADIFAMTDIQLAESERRRALGRLTSQFAREIYNQLMEDF